MPKDDLHFRLRIPDRLKAKVESAAAGNHRSMTAEILARLDSTFDSKTDDLPASIAEIGRKVDHLIEVLSGSILKDRD